MVRESYKYSSWARRAASQEVSVHWAQSIFQWWNENNSGNPTDFLIGSLHGYFLGGGHGRCKSPSENLTSSTQQQAWVAHMCSAMGMTPLTFTLSCPASAYRASFDSGGNVSYKTTWSPNKVLGSQVLVLSGTKSGEWGESWKCQVREL